MQGAEVQRRLQQMGIYLSADGDNIRVGPKSALTDELRQLIRAHKPTLLRELQAANDDPAQAAREAAEERAGILEHDGGLSRPNAEAVATLAEAFYNHLFGPGKVTNCCYAPAGRYCPEGRRLRDAYYRRAVS